jgi:hypothetical protein
VKRLIDLFLSVPPSWALRTVFLLTAAEAALFFGFVIPGEIAVVLGGVLASFGKIALWKAIAAAVGGAILGDSIGFQVGSRSRATAPPPSFSAASPLFSAPLSRPRPGRPEFLTGRSCFGTWSAA